jgi:Tol biopolymer transport system component
MPFARTCGALLTALALAGCGDDGQVYQGPTGPCASPPDSTPALCALAVSPDPAGLGPATTITLSLTLSDQEDDLLSAVARLVPVTDATGGTDETGGARPVLRYTADLSGRVPNPPANQAALQLDIDFLDLVNEATGTAEVPQAGFYRLELDGSDAAGNSSNVAIDTFEVRVGAPVGGSKIAFVSTRDGDVNQEIFIMNAADGSGVTQLTATAAGVINRRPALSPDGSKIVFTSTRDGGTGGKIYIMNAADGSAPMVLTSTADLAIDDSMPAFSPDGSKIAFASNSDGNYEIWVMNADGSNPVQLTTTAAPTINRRPTFNADGSKIAFASNSDGNYEIYVVNADGTGTPTRLTTTSAPVANLDPAFSPDGSKIAFESDRSVDEQYEIWIMDADGSGPVQLTTVPTSLTDHHWPAFSPDGTRIAFDSDRDLDGNDEIYTMNAADGSGMTRLTITSGITVDDTNPAWR